MKKNQTMELPVMPLRGLVLFPNMVLHFDVGRKMSLAALEQGMMEQQRIFLVSQKKDETEDPGWDDLCKVGTVAEIRQVMNLPGENVRVLVEGISRGTVEERVGEDPGFRAVIRTHEDRNVRTAGAKALLRTSQDLFETYARSSQKVSQDMVESIHEVEKPGEAADLLAANVLYKREDRQEILDELDPLARLEKVCAIRYRLRRRLLRFTFASIIARRPSIGTRSCCIVSRSRTVTQRSLRDSWSTVMQNGVPMASWRR